MTETLYRWHWVALALVLTAEIMDLLDATVVGLAAPSIREELGGSYATLQWLAAAYTLAMAVGLLTGGRLGDIVGRKPAFLVGAIGFTVASLACGLAGGPGWLVAFRVVQGLFGALMLPQGLGMIKEMFPPKEQAGAFGAFGPVMGLAAVAGPVVAGTLIDLDLGGLGWRLIFLINVPLGLFAVLGGLKFLPGTPGDRNQKLDVVGVVLAASASFLLLYPLVQGRELGWPLWSFGLMVAAVPVAGLFVLWERRVLARGGDPLVVPSLFAHRGFSGGLLVGVVFFGVMIGLSLVIGLFFQLGLGWSPLRAALTQIPFALGIAVGTGLAGAVLAARFGRRVIHAGILVMALGAVLTWLTVQRYGIDVVSWQFIPALFVFGAGMGLVLAPFFDIVLAGVELSGVGSASGVLNSTQQLGGALGVAVIGTLFFTLIAGQSGASVDAVAPSLRSTLAGAGVSAADQDRVVAGLTDCATDRANATDPSTTPASCDRLTALVGTVAPDPAVGRAIQAAGGEVAERSFAGGMQKTLWATVAGLVLSFLLAFMLPRFAREQPAPEKEPVLV